MIKKMGYEWHLRQRMAERKLFQTTDMVPLLAERGVVLSREQVYRLVPATATAEHGRSCHAVRRPRVHA